MKQRIVPNLWFDGQAEQAAEFYVSLFPNSKILGKSYYTEVGPGAPGTVLTVKWELDGQQFVGINGGPDFTFDDAVSFEVPCDDQKEIDRLWAALLKDGGKEQQCGWITDKFGLAWQIVPAQLEAMVMDADSEKVNRVMEAMLQMIKLDIDTLQKAYDGV